MLAVLFRLIGRNFWVVTALLFAGTVGAIYLADYQAMAILGCCFGGMLMWQAERDNAPAAASVELPAVAAEQPAH